MKPWITGTIAGLLLLVGSSFSAMAELSGATATVLCGASAEIDAVLTDKYGERKVEFGIAGAQGNAAAILWVNEDAPTWSFVIYNPVNGTACIFAAGGEWGDLPAIVEPASTY